MNDSDESPALETDYADWATIADEQADFWPEPNDPIWELSEEPSEWMFAFHPTVDVSDRKSVFDQARRYAEHAMDHPSRWSYLANRAESLLVSFSKPGNEDGSWSEDQLLDTAAEVLIADWQADAAREGGC